MPRRRGGAAVQGLRELVAHIRRNPAGGPAVSYDSDGNGHYTGGFGRALDRGDLVTERMTYGYRKSDAEAFRDLLAASAGWRGDLLHPSPGRDAKGRAVPCRCKRCRDLRRSRDTFCDLLTAEAVLVQALDSGSDEVYYRPTAGAERARDLRANRTEAGRCSRCGKEPRPGRTTCQACCEAQKAAMRASRARRNGAG